MIILKDFYRKKTTKVATIVFIFLILIIYLIFSLRSYYANFVAKSYQENTYLLIKSKSEMAEKLKNTNIVGLERVVLLSPDLNSNFDYSLLLDSSNTEVIAKKGDNLAKEQCILEISNELYNDSIDTNNITLLSDNKRLIFNVKNVRRNIFSSIIISSENFNKLSYNSFVYTAKIKEYKKISKLLAYLDAFEEIDEVTLVRAYQKADTIDTVLKYEQVLTMISKVLIIIGLIFVFIYLLFLRNVLIDEMDEMDIEKKLGFSNKSICFIIIIKLFLLVITAFIIAFNFNVFINLLLNAFKINVEIINLYMSIRIFLLLVFTTFAFALICYLFMMRKLNKFK